MDLEQSPRVPYPGRDCTYDPLRIHSTLNPRSSVPSLGLDLSLDLSLDLRMDQICASELADGVMDGRDLPPYPLSPPPTNLALQQMNGGPRASVSTHAWGGDRRQAPLDEAFQRSTPRPGRSQAPPVMGFPVMALGLPLQTHQPQPGLAARASQAFPPCRTSMADPRCGEVGCSLTHGGRGDGDNGGTQAALASCPSACFFSHPGSLSSRVPGHPATPRQQASSWAAHLHMLVGCNGSDLHPDLPRSAAPTHTTSFHTYTAASAPSEVDLSSKAERPQHGRNALPRGSSRGNTPASGSTPSGGDGFVASSSGELTYQELLMTADIPAISVLFTAGDIPDGGSSGLFDDDFITDGLHQITDPPY